MGFYDVRCAISGVTLLRFPASVVLVLAETAQQWHAISPPIRGDHNRLGTLDLTDASAERWAADLLAKLHVTDDYRAMAEAAAADHYPPQPPGTTALSLLLHLFDRVTVHRELFQTDGIRLDDHALGYAFISAPIFDAIAAREPASAPADAVIRWARDRGSPIVPLTMAAISQDSIADTPKSLATARARLADVEWLLPILKQLTIEHFTA